jgi:hypothetical protein
MTESSRETLRALEEAGRALASSPHTFDDDGQYRVEIPSVEGPEAFEVVVAEAERLGVPLHRVSQGSGITLLRDDDLRRYVELGSVHGVEVCLFVGPRAPWNGEASALTPDGKYFGWRHLTVATLSAAYDDVVRAVELGIRSFLVADEGLTVLIERSRRDGALPDDLVVKASAVLGLANPVGSELLARSGADTLNLAGDTPLAELAAFRSILISAIDLYIEGPDGLGGFLRYHDVGEIVRIAAPVHLKFGLRNAPNIYPSGAHLEAVAQSTARERVRRAAIGLEHLTRQYPKAVMSPTGRRRPGVPVVVGGETTTVG